MAADSGSRESRRKSGTDDSDLRLVRELLPSARGGPTVVCVSDDAWAAGVRPGMPLAEARSMAVPLLPSKRQSVRQSIPETQFIEWSPAEDRRELTAVAELTRRFAPVVGLDEMPVPDSLLLDVSGCGQLFGGEASLAEQLVRRLTQQQLQCRAAISDSVAASWAFTHATGHFLHSGQGRRKPATTRRQTFRTTSSEWETPVIIIPPRQSESWLHPLPVAAARIPPGDAELLFQLGILNIKQLLGLPAEDLPTRLSDAAIRRIQQLRGIAEELITAIPEADPVSATWVSEFAATNRGEVWQVLEHLVGRIAEQLQRRCLGAVELHCRLKREDDSFVSLAAEMVRPVQSATELLEVLKLRLESLRIEQPVCAVSMQATAAPLPLARQKDLFSTCAHIEPVEELTAVINRLGNRLGRESVLTVTANSDPVPEHAVRLSPVMNSQSSLDATASRLEQLVVVNGKVAGEAVAASRPLHLFPVPGRIAVTGQNLLTDGFLWNGERQTVARFSGPERIQTHWWHETSVHRDYYRISTATGSQLWVFQDISTGEWLLHGLFE